MVSNGVLQVPYYIPCIRDPKGASGYYFAKLLPVFSGVLGFTNDAQIKDIYDALIVIRKGVQRFIMIRPEPARQHSFHWLLDINSKENARLFSFVRLF